MRRLARLAVAGLVFGLTLGLPETALAHAIGGRADLPLPIEALIVGGGLMLVLAFVALALLWPEPRLQGGPAYTTAAGLGSPRWLRWLLAVVGMVSLALVIGQVVPEWLGVERDVTRPTIAPVMVWVVFWLIVPLASAVIGNWYADLNPWRVLGRAVRSRERPELEARLGLWPATLVFVAFVWLELISSGPGDPVALGYAALIYTVFLLGAMVFSGRDPGLVVFDPFTSYNRLFSAISPLGRDEKGRVLWRGWLRSLTVLPEWPGLWAFAVAMVGTVAYDGASGTEWFGTLVGGLGDTSAGRTLLLALTVVVVGAGYLATCAAMSQLGRGSAGAIHVAQRFAHTLVPVALVYVFAHYFSLVVYEGQQLVAAVSDPFALGWDLFGTADRRIDFSVVATDTVWYTQVASIVIGHVIAVVLAHDRALRDFGRDALRSQYAMLLLMVALTTLGLLLLSA